MFPVPMFYTVCQDVVTHPLRARVLLFGLDITEKEILRMVCVG